MSNLHLWKTKGKNLAAAFREARESEDYATMRRIQNQIGIKRK